MALESAEERARMWAGTAQEAFADAARYLRSIPEDEWSGPTGCSDWTVRDLAGHIAGEAVWFANVICGATRGEAPLPMSLYEEMKTWPIERLTGTIASAAGDVWSAIDESTPEELERTVDMGWTHLPVWRAAFVSATEGVFHNWDARAERESQPTIPTPWALALVDELITSAPRYARRREIAGAAGTYLLEIDNGVGPVTVTAGDGRLTVERGATDRADVTLHLTADQYCRLIAGRFDPDNPKGGEVRIDGDRRRAAGLHRIFGGIANE